MRSATSTRRATVLMLGTISADDVEVGKLLGSGMQGQVHAPPKGCVHMPTKPSRTLRDAKHTQGGCVNRNQ